MDIPEEIRGMLGQSTMGEVVIKRFYFNDLKIIKPEKISLLGQYRVDRYRAAKSYEIGIAYDIALAKQNGDI